MRRMISIKWVFSLYILFLFSGSFSSYVSAKPPPILKFVSGITSNMLSAIFKWLWSLEPTNKISFGVLSGSKMKYERGYSVETVFDGSKLGIEPYSVEVTQSGELLVLDSENSNIHKISTPLSRYSRPTLVAGSSEGYSGHVDGKLRQAKMNHPKGLTVDNRGNIYVADTKNMAIRKISDTGVVTIAGGHKAQGLGHVDGPSDHAKFSNDFDVIYVASSCSILVVDRGNRAIREIQLHDDDCSFYHYDGSLHLGIAVLSVAVFFGFMLALLQSRVATLFSSSVDQSFPIKDNHPVAYQKLVKSVRPPLIPPEADEYNKEEERLFNSLGKLFTNTGTAISNTFASLFSSSKNKSPNAPQMRYQQPTPYFNTWPTQEKFIVSHDYIPPLLQARDPIARKVHKLTTKNPEKARHLKQGRHNKHVHQQHHQMHYLSGPQTYYEEKNETIKEVVFGAVQEHDRTVSIKTIDYSSPSYNIHNLRSRYNKYMGYSYDMYS